MKLFKLFTIFNFDSKLRIIQSRRKVSKEISRFFSKIYLMRTQVTGHDFHSVVFIRDP